MVDLLLMVQRNDDFKKIPSANLLLNKNKVKLKLIYSKNQVIQTKLQIVLHPLS